MSEGARKGAESRVAERSAGGIGSHGDIAYASVADLVYVHV